MVEGRAEPVIEALLACPSRAEAAQLAGISLPTLKRYLSDPEFLRLYRAARRESHEFAIAMLQERTALAVRVLEAELCSAKASDRIRAATAILDHASAGSKFLDLVDDVEELKKQVAKWLEATR